MVFSGVLKLKFGPFWVKTSILLVNVLTFGHNARYVLRVERPAICGGLIDLPIGRHGFPIALLPRSANDRRILRFGIRYGAKAKTFRFLAPTAEVYDHWIAVLREAFQTSSKMMQRVRKETASTIESGRGDSDGDGRAQPACATDSTRGQCGSDQLDTSRSAFGHQLDFDTDVSFADGDNTNDNLYDALTQRVQACRAVHVAAEKTQNRDILGQLGNANDTSDTSSSGGLTPIFSDTNYPPDASPIDGDVNEGQQNVFCMATDRNGATSFSVYTPPNAAVVGHTPRPESVFKLSSAEWARWLARDIRDNDIPPEVFHLTSTSCKRLLLQEIVAIARPFFA
ncbi:hypothetical protein PF004_g5979 [Phytophthora fragariae]|uniref:PH domain-containing protein n=1 Tax=Phytophthora fragariae TaxID=53985 RepID=A0A6G0PE59_9STRA|nr:hypothetical protein PF004_g5979 [Phytophthora fragariae]